MLIALFALIIALISGLALFSRKAGKTRRIASLVISVPAALYLLWVIVMVFGVGPAMSKGS